jgi:hypothetical protein
VLAYTFGTGQLLWTMVWFFFIFIWIWIVVSVFVDIFRSHDLSGWAKAAWVIFIVILPWLGVLVYLIARGSKMHEREMRQAARSEAQFRQYVQETAASSGGGTADELAKLADLKNQGVLTDAEFEAQKAKLLT